MRQAVLTNRRRIELGLADEDDAILRCPECGNKGGEMEVFSFLKAGFNGIESGDADDLDCLECGKCGAKLEFPEGLMSHNEFVR